MIVIDTSVLSLAFRRRSREKSEEPVVGVLRRLIEEDQPLVVPGIVLQELLSGVQNEVEFQRLRDLMEGFPVILAAFDHHLAAANISNACRRKGIAVSAVGCLIAATAVVSQSELLTTDGDFERMAPLCGLRLCRQPGS